MTTIVLWVDRFEECAEFYRVLLRGSIEDRSETFLNVVSSAGRVALHKVPAEWASEIESPPVLRETNPIKPVFMVNSIALVRDLIEQTEGRILEASKEFSHGDFTYCDGFDPDGNIIQACEETSHE